MKYTSVYKFNKPELTDLPDIGVLNENFDAIDAAFQNYLPLIGGKVDGTIISADNASMYRDGTNGYLGLFGSSTDWWNKGANLCLYGIDSDGKGSFSLGAVHTENGVLFRKNLLARGDGTLIWDDKNILRSINGVEADKDGNAKVNSFDIRATNPITAVANDTVGNWKNIEGGIYWFNKEGCLTDQPSTYGFLTHIVQGTDIYQTFKVQANGSLYYRSGSINSWAHSWKEFGTEESLAAIIEAANKVNEVEVDEATAKVEDLQVAVARIETYPQVIESYRNGTSWYRKWSDGWIEQGGQYIQSAAEITVPLITKFTTNSYHADFVIHSRTYNAVNVLSQTTEAINVYSGSNGVNMVVLWKACGY